MEEIARAVYKQFIYAKTNVKRNKLKIEVISDCMKPLIEVGDKVEVCDCSKYVKGDIVAIYFNNQFYIHRVLSISETTVITKGDRTFSLDPETSISHIIGIVSGNVTQQTKFLRNKVATLIAGLSLLESKIFDSMNKDGNHKKLRLIYCVRQLICWLFFCVKRKKTNGRED